VSARFVVLHGNGLATGAPDPRDRQLLRRVRALAVVAEVTLVCSEPQLGPLACIELGEAGVSVIDAPARVDAWLATCESAVVVVATSISLGERVQRIRPELSLVLELASAADLDDDDDPDADPLEHAGLVTLRSHERARARAVLGHAQLVFAASERLAELIAEAAPGAQVVVAEPPVPATAPRSAPLGRRVAVVGALTPVRGWTVERALVALVDAGATVDTDVVAVGTDASLLRRALASEVRFDAPRDVSTASRQLRAAVVVRGAHSNVAELRGLGVPVVTIDGRDDVDTTAQEVGRLVRDDDAWTAAHLRSLEIAVARHEPEHANERYLAALREAGLLDARPGEVADSTSSPRADGAWSWERRFTGGSLAAQTAHSEQLRREAQPDAIIPWTHALYANLDLAPDVAYRRWLAVHHDVDARRPVLLAQDERLVAAPLISVVMPVHNTDPIVLRAAIESVRSQIWSRWQLCIVDDGSTNAATRGVLRDVRRDDRIDIVRAEVAEGIAAATNRAIALARGSYVAFLDHDDVLTADALHWVVHALDIDPAADIVYSDEDKLDEQGNRVEPFFKPDWSPDLLLSCNYITHLLVVRRSLLERVGGLRPEFDGAQDYDLLLRLTEHTDRVVHVPKPLYSWRKSPTSTAADIHAKPQAHAASRRALDEAIARRSLDATRDEGVDPTWHRVRYNVAHRPLVTVVIPTRDRVDLLQPCVELLSRVMHRPIEVLIVDNDSSDPATLDYLEHVDAHVVSYPHRFNYARQMNLAALEAHGEVLLLLNNDARPVGSGWLDAMLEHALRPEVGAVGARLRFPDGRAQHEGIVLNAGGVALNLDAGPYAVLSDNVRDVAAVTGACLMVRRSVWDAVGGMDERLRVAYNDVDFCLRVGERGWRNIYTPLAELTHAESSSRGSLHPEIDEAFYQRRWGIPRTCADPFFTTSLELLTPFSPRL
jgi:GT2 family glycosyltransferase